MIVFVIIILALLTGVIYSVILLAVKLTQSVRKANPAPYRIKKQRLVYFICAFLGSALTTYFFLFTSPATNYRMAYIEKEQQGYKVTVKGKRPYMAHDPVSLFLRETYEDSAQYFIPRNEGIITGKELPTRKGHYNSVGNILIQGKSLKIDLYADNYDDKRLDPVTWNGTYDLIWRQK